MNIQLIGIGKTKQSWLQEGMLEYEKRIGHYANYSRIELPNLAKRSKLSQAELCKLEGAELLKSSSGYLILLDVTGKAVDSPGMAGLLTGLENENRRSVDFMIGGAYGFSDEVIKAADRRISLSLLTFSHQIIRLVFLEQLYRAFTIKAGESYHHG